MDDPFVGTITFCRIYSGKLESGTGVMNSTKERKERVGRMLLMHANNREDIKEAYAGDIVALAGLKENYHDIEIPADLKDQALEYRHKLLEAAVELDDEVLAAYLDGNEPDVATLKRLIRKAVITGAFFPVLAGSEMCIRDRSTASSTAPA